MASPNSAAAAATLTEAVSNRIFHMIREVRAAAGAAYVVLVVDDESVRVVNYACRMFDIIEQGVIVVEPIKVKRQRLANHAIYLLGAEESSVDALISDYSNPAKPQYGPAHVYFLAPIPNFVLEKVRKAGISQHLANFAELNCDFVAHESRVFSFDRQDSLAYLYFPDYRQSFFEDELYLLADKLLTVFLTLKEYPYIRYQRNPQNNVLERLAQILQQKLEDAIRQITTFQYSERRPTLLLTDRTIDPVAPLIHEFTYQAMAYDLLPIRGQAYEYHESDSKGPGNTISHMLSDNDTLWTEIRHSQIGDAITVITTRFNEFISKNAATNLRKEAYDLQEMRAAIRDMPQYKELVKLYSVHIQITTDCIQQYESKRLNDVGSLEQDLATGFDSDGRKPNKQHILEAILKLIQDPGVGQEDKFRLILIYIITQEDIEPNTRHRLFNLGDIGQASEDATINVLQHLGVSMRKAARKSKKQKSYDKNRQKQRQEKLAARARSTYHLARFIPVLSEIVEDQLTQRLSTEEFPYVYDPPPTPGGGASLRSMTRVSPASSGAQPTSLRTKKSGGNAASVNSSWQHGSLAKSMADSKLQEESQEPKLIVFMVGGMTYSETRTIYELSKNSGRDILIGSTCLLTPTKFIQSIRDKPTSLQS